MLSYQHIFHAGNFADVHKHVVLLHALRSIQARAGRVVSIDSHGGEGVYDLQSAAAQKNREAGAGVLRLVGGDGSPPPVAEYLQLVAAVNLGKGWRYYPGSPELLRRASRKNDHIIVIEKHPAAATQLKGRYRGDKRMRIVHADAYSTLRDFRPAPNAAVFVVIDPAYEKVEEWGEALNAVKECLSSWPNASVMLWYPITAAGEHRRVAEAARNRLGVRAVGIDFFALPNDVHRRLNGSGILVVNPPDGFLDSLEQTLAWLYSKLASPHAPQWTIEHYER